MGNPVGTYRYFLKTSQRSAPKDRSLPLLGRVELGPGLRAARSAARQVELEKNNRCYKHKAPPPVSDINVDPDGRVIARCSSSSWSSRPCCRRASAWIRAKTKESHRHASADKKTPVRFTVTPDGKRTWQGPDSSGNLPPKLRLVDEPGWTRPLSVGRLAPPSTKSSWTSSNTCGRWVDQLVLSRARSRRKALREAPATETTGEEIGPA